jgi:hypothetical protein
MSINTFNLFFYIQESQHRFYLLDMPLSIRQKSNDAMPE